MNKIYKKILLSLLITSFVPAKPMDFPSPPSASFGTQLTIGSIGGIAGLVVANYQWGWKRLDLTSLLILGPLYLKTLYSFLTMNEHEIVNNKTKLLVIGGGSFLTAIAGYRLIAHQFLKKNYGSSIINHTDGKTLPLDVEELKQQIVNPEIFNKWGLTLPKGFLFVGKPGTGKTETARCIASQIVAGFIYISAPELQSMWLGQSAAKVRELFLKAQRYVELVGQPVIIFIDEFDSIALNRSEQSAYLRDVVNQILTEMDGFVQHNGIIVIAATNDADALDPAIKRVGRFSKHIEFRLPNQEERKKVFTKNIKKIDNELHNLTTEDILEIAVSTDNLNYADLNEVCDRAVRFAIRENITLSLVHFQRAIEAIQLQKDPARQDYITTKNHITFADLGGSIPEEIVTLVEYIKDPDSFTPYNIIPSKGYLFLGPPGTGKTITARAIAGEVNAGFIRVSGPELHNKWIGGSAENIRKLFKKAREYAITQKKPVIIFIDEFDAIGITREIEHQAHTQALEQLLSEMDGFKPNSNVFVIAATNYPDRLDTAITRSGRLETHINFKLPNEEKRKDILNRKISELSAIDNDSIDINELIELTSGCNCADLDSIMQRAAIMAWRSKGNVSQTMLKKAIQDVKHQKR